MDFIPVSGDFCETYNLIPGDFCETYNLIACISGNPLKEKSVVYTIGKENGMATAFVSFCQMMVVSGCSLQSMAIYRGGIARY
jgi:hypothetical protein